MLVAHGARALGATARGGLRRAAASESLLVGVIRGNLVGRYTQRRSFWARLKQWTKPKSKEELEAAELERVKKQERLKEELRRGYFWELGEVNRTKCKLFDADKELLPLEKSFPFPSFKADSLLGIEHAFETLLSVKNQVALVGMCFRDAGFKELPTWLEPFQREFANVPAVQVYQVNFEDKTWLKALKFLLINGQRSQIERDRHGSCFNRFGDHLVIREALKIENRMVGYVFLVDSKGRVRWRGTGSAREDEVASLLKCGHELLDESKLQGSKGDRKSRYSSSHRPRRPASTGVEAEVKPAGPSTTVMRGAVDDSIGSMS